MNEAFKKYVAKKCTKDALNIGNGRLGDLLGLDDDNIERLLQEYERKKDFPNALKQPENSVFIPNEYVSDKAKIEELISQKGVMEVFVNKWVDNIVDSVLEFFDSPSELELFTPLKGISREGMAEQALGAFHSSNIPNTLKTEGNPLYGSQDYLISGIDLSSDNPDIPKTFNSSLPNVNHIYEKGVGAKDEVVLLRLDAGILSKQCISFRDEVRNSYVQMVKDAVIPVHVFEHGFYYPDPLRKSLNDQEVDNVAGLLLLLMTLNRSDVVENFLTENKISFSPENLGIGRHFNNGPGFEPFKENIRSRFYPFLDELGFSSTKIFTKLDCKSG